MAAKKVTHATVNLGDLIKQVPKNQKEKFLKFRDLTAKYQSRVDRYPENLPKIDWEFYRNNVRKDFVNMVNDFEKQYEELRNVFTTRYEMLDLSKYYIEVVEQKKETEVAVEDYIKQSNKNIKKLEAEIEHIKNRLPYSEMTMEEFCELVPEKNPYIPCSGRKTFWPFFPNEQNTGPAQNLEEQIENSKDSKQQNEDKSKEASTEKSAKPDPSASKSENKMVSKDKDQDNQQNKNKSKEASKEISAKPASKPADKMVSKDKAQDKNQDKDK